MAQQDPTARLDLADVAATVIRRYTEMDQQIAATLARVDRPLSCQLGCDACCHYPLRVGWWELATIRAALSQRPAATRKRIARQTRDATARLIPLRANWDGFPETEPQRLAYCKARIRCPLLLNQRCATYEQRPVACRTHFAVSPAELCFGGDQPIMVPDLQSHEATLRKRLAEDGIELGAGGELLIDALGAALAKGTQGGRR